MTDWLLWCCNKLLNTNTGASAHQQHNTSAFSIMSDYFKSLTPSRASGADKHLAHTHSASSAAACYWKTSSRGKDAIISSDAGKRWEREWWRDVLRHRFTHHTRTRQTMAVNPCRKYTPDKSWQKTCHNNVLLTFPLSYENVISKTVLFCFFNVWKCSYLVIQILRKHCIILETLWECYF